jgi:hypothetical protein
LFLTAEYAETAEKSAGCDYLLSQLRLKRTLPWKWHEKLIAALAQSGLKCFLGGLCDLCG